MKTIKQLESALAASEAKLKAENNDKRRIMWHLDEARLEKSKLEEKLAEKEQRIKELEAEGKQILHYYGDDEISLQKQLAEKDITINNYQNTINEKDKEIFALNVAGKIACDEIKRQMQENESLKKDCYGSEKDTLRELKDFSQGLSEGRESALSELREEIEKMKQTYNELGYYSEVYALNEVLKAIDSLALRVREFLKKNGMGD